MGRRSPLLLVLVLAASTAQCQTAPRDAPSGLTPHVTRPMHRVRIVVPAKFRGAFPEDQWVWVPEGWGVGVFHAGNLGKPRFLDWGPDSVLYVADLSSKQVLALPDRDRDGVADTSIVAADDVAAHDIAFFRGAMYAAEMSRVLRLVDADGDGRYETRSVFIDGIPGTGHSTRTIVFDSTHGAIFISVGSNCNACRESTTAAVWAYDLDGRNGRVYADGIRNAVGLALHPATGALWATNNGQDWQGDDVPPEWISIVRDGGFYGYPIAYSDRRYFDFTVNEQYRALLPITAADSARVGAMRPFSAEVTAHSAPMAIAFSNEGLPEPYRHGAFVALHGSWNRSVPSGYKIVYLDFDGPSDTIARAMSYVLAADTAEVPSPVLSMRPCGLALDARGDLYFSSDHQNAIIGILYPQPLPGFAPTGDASAPTLRVDPSPARSHATVRFALDAPARCSVELFDAKGSRVAVILDAPLDPGAREHVIDTGAYPSGLYSVRLTAGARTETARLLIVH
jgi:glucose/arabinose dehydrogenase